MNEQSPIHQGQSAPTARPVARHAIAAAVALALAAGGVALAEINTPAAGSVAVPATVAAVGLPSFADVAERVVPAVVNVTVTSESSPAVMFRGHPGMQDNLPVPEFFRRFFDERGQLAPRQTQGQGSGFLVDAEGHVVTNNHVIDGATQVTVVLNDGSSHEARVVGRDDKTDLALLKIDAGRPLAYVELGDSGKARVGDWVLAVGNPFGLGGSVNAGIISARGRDIHSGPYDDYLQIDAPINRGNSGGPLFDTSGRVIGVNTAIYSPTGGSVGIGFAIPAETVRQVVAELKTTGRVARGWLGVQIQAVTPELAAGLGLDRPDGVLIAEVLADGPASKSNLRAGDVILSLNGQPLENYRDLPKRVAATPAGSRLNLEVWRNGKPWQVAITVGQMPDDTQQAALPAGGAPDASQPRLGLALAPLTPELRLQNGLDANREGLYVTQVEPGSPAARAGIEAGSLISMVGADPLTSPEQLQAAVRKAVEDKRTAVILRVERGDKALFVAVPVEQR
ncbi:Do family serine endopeptidase [Thiobaca trueperi]|uniref:Probable periplasmic serine endoprotease DegP-like n=1 Tax=Thiobaca trueperi TaxID=127458 RepID=A0A4R3N3F1_9GAMM|nr:Do family serine endopeptidase [Thiobaca trueperi]TCT22731.1 serine protease Do [Thiobaca trueperi]